MEPEQKKEILNTLVEQFVLDKSDKVELRFKLPVNENQVAENILTLSRNDTTFGNNNYDAIRTLDKGRVVL